MLSKKVLKDIQSLGVKKHRAERSLFLAEGPKVVQELMAARPQQIVGIYALKDVMKKYQNAMIPVVEVSEVELQRISSLKSPNEVLAVVQQFSHTEPVNFDGICIYLDAVQDPGNLGTIIRIADWFGVQNIICAPGCADVYNAKVVQSTMASISRVNIWYDEADTWLAKQNVPVYAAVLEGVTLQKIGAIKKGILLIGNESKGLRKETQDMATFKITIPRIGQAESLNAAVATGIILSHFISIETV